MYPEGRMCCILFNQIYGKVYRSPYLRGSLGKNLMTSLDQEIDFSQTLYLRFPL